MKLTPNKMINNKPRGICLNKNAINIQLAPPAGREENGTNNLDNLKAAALSLENPQPLSQLHQNPIKRLQLNFNKVNTIISDENAQQPVAKLISLKPLFTDKLGSRLSPNEPSPPKLRSYSRNSLRQHLPQPHEEEQFVSVDKPIAESKLQLQHPQQQDSIISRIPRLSYAFPRSTQTAPSLLAAMAEIEGPTEEIEDIDKSATRDAIYLVCDVAKDIYEYMFTLEEAQSIKENYLKDQKILTPKVRQRLINWCIEIHSQLKLMPETLYMTIAVIDRFFDRTPVKQQSQVQLVAVGATLIASKYEEIYPPDLGDLMHLTQNSYSRREIMRVEIFILEQLEFNLGRPIPLAFLRRFSKAAHCDLKMHSIAKYLMELSLTEYECSHWRPSMLAAAALFTTIHLVRQDNSPNSGSISRITTFGQPTQDRWNKALVHYTHYTRKQLQEPAGILCKILKRAQKNPQSNACVKKNLVNLGKWPELKSTRVDELIKLGDQM